MLSFVTTIIFPLSSSTESTATTFFFVTTDEVKFRQHKIVFEKRGAKVAIDPFVGHDPVVKTAKE